MHNGSTRHILGALSAGAPVAHDYSIHCGPARVDLIPPRDPDRSGAFHLPDRKPLPKRAGMGSPAELTITPP
jgi:hypothetical protein